MLWRERGYSVSIHFAVLDAVVVALTIVGAAAAQHPIESPTLANAVSGPTGILTLVMPPQPGTYYVCPSSQNENWTYGEAGAGQTISLYVGLGEFDVILLTYATEGGAPLEAGPIRPLDGVDQYLYHEKVKYTGPETQTVSFADAEMQGSLTIDAGGVDGVMLVRQTFVHHACGIRLSSPWIGEGLIWPDPWYRRIHLSGFEAGSFSLFWEVRTPPSDPPLTIFHGQIDSLSGEMTVGPESAESTRYVLAYDFPRGSGDVRLGGGLVGKLGMSGCCFSLGEPPYPIYVDVKQQPLAREYAPSTPPDVFFETIETRDGAYLPPTVTVASDRLLHVHVPHVIEFAGGLRSPERVPYALELEAGDTVEVMLAPLTWFGSFDNHPEAVRVAPNVIETSLNWTQRSNTLFLTQMRTALADSTPDFTLYEDRDGQLFELFRNTQSPSMEVPSPGRYVLETHSWETVVHDSTGTATVRATMDTRLSDPNPPNMIALHVMADGNFTDHIGHGRQGEVHVWIMDNDVLDEVAFFVRASDNDAWMPLSSRPIERWHVASLPSELSDAYYDLRIVATDASGNQLDYRASPAFAVGTPHPLDRQNPNPLPWTILLEQNFPNPFSSETTIQYALGEDGHVQLTVYDLLGRPLRRLVDGFQSAGRYMVRFDAADLPSGTYVYRLRAGLYRQTRMMIVAR